MNHVSLRGLSLACLLASFAALPSCTAEAKPTPAPVALPGKYKLLRDPIVQAYKANAGKTGVELAVLEKDPPHGNMNVAEDNTFVIHALVPPLHDDLKGTWKRDGAVLELTVTEWKRDDAVIEMTATDGPRPSTIRGTIDGRFLRVPYRVGEATIELVFEKTS